MRTAFLALAALLCAACERSIEVAPDSPAPGRIHVLEKAVGEGDTGWWPQVRFDASDRPHVAFCDVAHGDVRYATREGGAWRLEDVATEGAVGKYIAMALDAEGRPGLTFYDQTQELLWYARREGGAWHREIVAHGQELGVGGDLRYDAAGSPDLFFYDPRGKLMHAYRKAGATPTGWVIDTVGPAVSGFSARASAVARPDGFWVAYAGVEGTDTRVMLATLAGSTVTVTPVALERGAGWRPFLGLDGATPFLVVWIPTSRALGFATRTDGAWTTARLTGEAGNYAAAQGTGGEVAVAYQVVRLRDAGVSAIRLLRRTAGKWRQVVVDAAPPSGDYLAVDLDSRGRALVAYHTKARHAIELYDETDAGSGPSAPSAAPAAGSPDRSAAGTPSASGAAPKAGPAAPPRAAPGTPPSAPPPAPAETP